MAASADRAVCCLPDCMDKGPLIALLTRKAAGVIWLKGVSAS